MRIAGVQAAPVFLERKAAGHYSRPDVLKLTVDRIRRDPVEFD